MTIDKFTELRSLGTFAYKIKCTWENHVMKVELPLGREKE